jgi:hypothetical protein
MLNEKGGGPQRRLPLLWDGGWRWKGKTFHTWMSFFIAWLFNHAMCKLGLKKALYCFFFPKNIEQFSLSDLSFEQLEPFP